MHSGFLQGIQAANQSITIDRAEKQRELSNLIKGFEKDATGTYVANERGQRALDANDQVVQKQLYSLQATNELLQATMNAKDFGTLAEHLAMGDQESAVKQLNNSPLLKQKIQQQYGVSTVVPVNWATDADKLKAAGIYLSPEDFKDPTKVNALNSSFFKMVKLDGSTEIGSVTNLLKTMNYEQYAEPSKLKGLEARFERVQEILAGNLKSPEQKQYEAEQEQLKLAKAQGANIAQKSTNDITSLKAEVIDNIMTSDLSAEEKLAKIQGANKTIDYDTLKKQLDIKGKLLDNSTKQIKIDAAKPVEGATEFIKSLGTLEYNDENRRTAGRLQGKDKLDVTTKAAISTRKALTTSFSTVYKRFATEEFDKNLFNTIGNAFASVTSSDLSLQEKEKYLTALSINTELKDALFRYVKLMSGAAVSDNERANYESIITNGNWSDKESALTTLASFTKALANSTTSALEGIKYETPRSYLDRRDDYNKAVTDALNIVTTKVPKVVKGGVDLSKYVRGAK